MVAHPVLLEPSELATACLKMMQKEYDNLDAEVTSETIADHEMIGYDLNFYCLDLTNTTHIRSCRTTGATYLVFYQAEDREFDEIAPVFRAMVTSLLQ